MSSSPTVETVAFAAPGTQRRVATLAVLVALVVAAFEGTVVTTAMPTITAELGGLSLYSWVYSSFLVSSTIGVLVCGKLADGLGRRPVFVFGMGLFLLGSALCGAAQSITALIAFRAIQGLGAGAIQPVAMTISADIYSLKERARIQAMFTSVWGSASLLGPVLGGFIAMHLSWRWVFFVNLPIGALAVGLLLVSYRDPPRARGPLGGAHALLAGAAAASAIFALEPLAGIALWHRVTLGVVAVILTAIFVARQRTSESPLLPLALLPDPAVRAGLVASLFVGALLYAATAYVPLWMTREAHASPLFAGAALVFLLVGWAFGSSFGVRIALRHGMRASVGGGFSIALIGVTSLALIIVFRLPTAFAMPALFILGMGMGPAASTSLVVPQTHAPWQSRGAITSVIYATRTLGGSLAVAALGAAEADAAARFSALAATTLVAVSLSLWLAPRTA